MGRGFKVFCYEPRTQQQKANDTQKCENIKREFSPQIKTFEKTNLIKEQQNDTYLDHWQQCDGNLQKYVFHQWLSVPVDE